MIQLFKIKNYLIDTSKYSNLLHDVVVNEFEEKIANYVGAKYGVTFNSATSAIFLALLNKNTIVKVPSMIPPVVLNAIITSGNKYEFIDDVNWVGNSYTLHTFDDYKIVDSAQKIEVNQFKKECNPNDLMIFSFYPTKPIGSCDGGMIVSNDLDKITYLKEMALNGMSFSENNWERKIKFPGYKMYMNSIQCDIALRNFNFYETKLKVLREVRDFYNNELGYNNVSDHLYRIETSKRDNFIDFMKKNNIICGVHYEAQHLNPIYKIDNSNCLNSEIKSKLTVSIPFHEDLKESETKYIINKIKQFENDNNKFS
jgi:dTDP-4-amino-4,6-dideoxygalactose transaminase